MSSWNGSGDRRDRGHRARRRGRGRTPAAELAPEFTRVVSLIDGRASRARHPRQSGVGRPGEATLLTTVVSVDPICLFAADEQTFLRLAIASAGTVRGLARDLPIQMALADEQSFPHEGHCSSSTTSSILDGNDHGRAIFRNPERRLTPGLFVRLRLPGTGFTGKAGRGSRRGHLDLDRRFVRRRKRQDHRIEARYPRSPSTD